MGLNVEKLKAVLKSVGCEGKQAGTELYVMMPDNFPWYGDNDMHERSNSRIVATVSLSFGFWEFTEVWPTPDIRMWEGEPLGVEMRRGLVQNRNDAISELKNLDYEQLAAWLTNKIGEISKKTKAYRKLALNYQSKDYEV